MNNAAKCSLIENKKANLLEQLDSNYFSTTYVMKMFGLDRNNNIRKEKIKKIFKEE